MPVPSSINDLSTTAGSNSPAGSETPADGDNYIRALAAFIATLRDQLNGTASSTGTVKAAAFTGTHTGNITSGTYTPTLASIGNLASSTPRLAQYMRVGNVVTVSGNFDATATSAATVTMSMTLPVATTNFASAFQAGGGGASGTIALAFYATGSAQTVSASWVAPDTGTYTFGFSFTYLVV